MPKICKKLLGVKIWNWHTAQRNLRIRFTRASGDWLSYAGDGQSCSTPCQRKPQQEQSSSEMWANWKTQLVFDLIYCSSTYNFLINELKISGICSNYIVFINISFLHFVYTHRFLHLDTNLMFKNSWWFFAATIGGSCQGQELLSQRSGKDEQARVERRTGTFFLFECIFLHRDDEWNALIGHSCSSCICITK